VDRGQPYTDRPHSCRTSATARCSTAVPEHPVLRRGRANITFKILYNGFVANTGAQEIVGGKPVPELTRMLELEGVRTTVVLTKEPDAYRGAELAGNARVEPIERQEAVLRELAATQGVTVLIHDGICANERRRGRSAAAAGLEPLRRINEEVCEGWVRGR
jgi:indolepyruvate ferredoxin oxidoreductase